MPRSSIVLLFSVLALGVACSGSTGAGARSGEGATGQRDVTVEHEDCSAMQDGEKTDVNGDGRPDISVKKSGGRDDCRAVNLDFDGKVNVWSYYDSAGQLRRREADYDRDGRIDEIQLYKGGALVEKDRATTLNGQLDTWHYYQAGKLARTERDSDGDTVVDQWWEYPDAAKPECPTIHSDNDGDGKPDPGASVNVCKEGGYVPPERQGAAAGGPSFKQSDRGALPTETDSKEEGTEGEKKEGQ